FQRDLALSHSNLGSACRMAGRRVEAEKHNQEALTLYEKLVKDCPGVFRYALDLGGSEGNMGQYHRFLGNKTVALKWFARSISRLRRLVEKNPRNAEARHCLSNAYGWQAEMLHGMNRSTDAIGDLDRALAVGSPPNQTGLRAMKACILISMGEHAKAIIEADAA